MTSRERVQTAIERKTPDRVPCSGTLSADSIPWLCEAFNLDGPAQVEEFMMYDFRSVWPAYQGPELTVSPATGARMTDWGITAKGGDYALDGHPLAEATLHAIERYSYPQMDWYDFGGLVPDQADQYMISTSEQCCLFGKACDLMGTEQLMVNLFAAPELVHALIERITDVRIAFVRELLRAAPWIDVVTLGDDMGTQEDLLIRPEQWRAFVFPHLKRLAAEVHSFGKLAFYHSCGSIIRIIPGLIEAGVDILDNIQPSAKNMDARLIKKEFGRHLVLHAQPDQHVVLRTWSPEAVYRKCRDDIMDLAQGGGYIFSPQFSWRTTPPENVKAMLQAVREPL